jgi:hypothetical protein
MVAIALIATAGLASLAIASDCLRAVDRAHDAEMAVTEASRFLEAVALWPREDLDRRLGERPQGPWVLRIDRRSAEVYIVSLRDSFGVGLILSTSVFRPAPRDAAP